MMMGKAGPGTAATSRAELEARLAALTEVHEFYEFAAVDEEHFDGWLHERIIEARRTLGLPTIESPAVVQP